MRNSKMLAAAATVAVVVSACATGASELSGESPDVLVTDDVAVTRTHEAPSLHVDQDDSDIVYLSESELQSGDCRFYVSTDRGATWSAEASTVDSPLQSDKAEEAAPSPEVEGRDNCSLGSAGSQNIRTELDQAPDGTLYYTFHANDSNAEGSRSILVARSNDDGRTFETTVVDAGDEPGDEIEVNFQAHTAIDVDNPSLMYTMWRRSFEAVGEEDRPPTRPFMAVSEDGGVTYSEPSELLDINPGFDGPRPMVVDGQVFAFYRESAPSSNDGEEEANTMLQVIESDDQGQTWSEPSVISAELDASEPIPLYDREENLFHVVFHDNRNGDLDVFHTTSVDGEEWSEPQRLNDDEVENDFGQYYPQISQSPNGRIDVAWYDYRDDPGPPPASDEPDEPLGLGSNLGVLQSVYYTSSTDGGETWSENVRVNDVAIDRSIGTWNGQFFVVVPLSITSWDDRALVAWSDTRNGTNSSGTQDIFTSAITAGDDDATSAVAPVIAILGAVLLGAGLALLAAVVLMRRSRQDD